jgi:hypothetical protein
LFISVPTKQTVPDAPDSADLTVYTGEELRLDFTAPLSDGGSAVHSYQVRYRVSRRWQKWQKQTKPNEILLLTHRTTFSPSHSFAVISASYALRDDATPVYDSLLRVKG